MSLSKAQYAEIIRQQLDGDLTIMIDTPGFRQVIYRADGDKLGTMVGRPVAGVVKMIKLLSVADVIAVVITSCIGIPAFGMWGVLIIPGLLVAHMTYRGFASRGRQSLVGVLILLFLAVVVAVTLSGNLNIWARIFFVCGALVFFLTRLLYVVTSRFVFALLHSSYDFFAAFNLKPDGAPVPLLWTDPEITSAV